MTASRTTATSGARFAKWRAVIHVTQHFPHICLRQRQRTRTGTVCRAVPGTASCTHRRAGSAHGGVAYDRALRTCHPVSSSTRCLTLCLTKVSRFEGMLLKPNMVLAGKECTRQAPMGGGRDCDTALSAATCARRGAWHRVPVGRPKPPLGNRPSERNEPAAWSQALEAELLLRPGTSGSGPGGLAWTGREFAAGRQALYRRVKLNGAASVGKYRDEMEVALKGRDDPPHRRDWRDD